MNYSKYPTLNISPDKTVFNFISSGSKGDFDIEVQFTEDSVTGLFNLGFGVLMNDGEIDDIITIDNGDRDKILATVAGFLNDFLQTFPNHIVIFYGSTVARTRLYRRAISINYDELKKDFTILGISSDTSLGVESFNPAGNYEAFLIRRITFES